MKLRTGAIFLCFRQTVAQNSSYYAILGKDDKCSKPLDDLP